MRNERTLNRSCDWLACAPLRNHESINGPALRVGVLLTSILEGELFVIQSTTDVRCRDANPSIGVVGNDPASAKTSWASRFLSNNSLYGHAQRYTQTVSPLHLCDDFLYAVVERERVYTLHSARSGWK